MAVGKGSMARAAKTAEAGKEPAKKANEAPQESRKQAAAGGVKQLKKKTASTAKARIVYQTSSGVLERAALPNEIFAIGDAMPVYYL